MNVYLVRLGDVRRKKAAHVTELLFFSCLDFEGAKGHGRTMSAIALATAEGRGKLFYFTGTGIGVAGFAGAVFICCSFFNHAGGP